jgi:hypothetical protein
VINSILSHLYTDILQTLHIVTVHTFKMCMWFFRSDQKINVKQNRNSNS